MKRNWLRHSWWQLLVLAVLFGSTVPLVQAQPTVELIPSLGSGQPVGTRILLSGVAENVGADLPLYQFSSRPMGEEEFQVQRDFAGVMVESWV